MQRRERWPDDIHLLSNARQKLLRFSTLLLCLMAIGASDWAQSAPPKNVLGTVQAIENRTLTLKADAGTENKVETDSATKFLRLEPGQTSLKSAVPATLQDVQTGDRVLARGQLGADGTTLVPTLIVLMKGADVAQKREQERLVWQRNGVGGLVKSVDPATGDILIATAAFPVPRNVTIRITKQTIFRRYAPASVKFEDAKQSSISEIKPGDQLRARGTKSADGNEIDAEEVVSGSFRNISGTVISTDAANSTVTIMDLSSKKPETVKITPESQVRQLPPMMARMLAMRLKGGTTAAGGNAGTRPAYESGEGRRLGKGQNGAATPGGRENGGGGVGGSGGDLQQLLHRLPAVSLADLQKGEAVMLVATHGSQQLTAITMLTGVEPILAASNSSRPPSSLLTPWSLGGDGGQDLGGGTQ